MKTKLNKATKVKLNSIVASIKKRSIKPLSKANMEKLENVPPFAWPTKGVKTLPAQLKKFVVESKKAQSKKPLSAKVVEKLENVPAFNPHIMRQQVPKSVTRESLAKASKKGSRLAAVYANILKGVPTWKVQGHPAPQYTTGNMPGHTVLASSTVKVVKRGHSAPKALEAPYGKKPSKLFTPSAKDVELGKQVKALRAGTKAKAKPVA